MLDILHEQPDGASYDDLLRKLALHRMVDRGLVDVAEGQHTTTDAIRQQVKTWRS